jgi:hypothetical protein
VSVVEEGAMTTRAVFGCIATAASLSALAAPGAASAADALAGRALFIGARPFAAGGPPCGACHAVGGASAPFAAALGPELSRSFEGMDAAAVGGILQDLPFPTMAPLYSGRPLTPAEREDLSAFLLQVAGHKAPGGAAVAGWAALLAALSLGAMALAARRVKGSTRAELLARGRAHPRVYARRKPAEVATRAAETPSPAAAVHAQGESQ